MENSQILFNGITLLIIIAIYMAYLRLSIKSLVSGLGFWFIAVTIYLVAMLAINFRQYFPDQFITVFTNSCYIAACCFLYLGIRKFCHNLTRSDIIFITSLYFGTLFLHLVFTIVIESSIIRTVIFVLGAVPVVLLSSINIIRHKQHQNLPGKLTLLFMYLFIVSCLLRLVAAPLYPGESVFEPQNIVTKISLIGLASTTGGFAFGLVLLVVWKLKEQADKTAADREVLIRETHHRIKNNLAMVQSILSIEAQKFDEQSTAKQSLQECRNRISSISNVHEMLYQQENLQRNRLDIYLHKVAKDVFGSYDLDQVKLQFKSQPIETNTNQLVTCGLILNELISNACKYAFPNNKSGKISIYLASEQSAENDNQMVSIQVNDNGIGISDEHISNDSQSFGMNMIKQLVSQMNGELKFHNDAGTSCKIKIPA